MLRLRHVPLHNNDYQYRTGTSVSYTGDCRHFTGCSTYEPTSPSPHTERFKSDIPRYLTLPAPLSALASLYSTAVPPHTNPVNSTSSHIVMFLVAHEKVPCCPHRVVNRLFRHEGLDYHHCNIETSANGEFCSTHSSVCSSCVGTNLVCSCPANTRSPLGLIGRASWSDRTGR